MQENFRERMQLRRALIELEDQNARPSAARDGFAVPSVFELRSTRSRPSQRHHCAVCETLRDETTRSTMRVVTPGWDA